MRPEIREMFASAGLSLLVTPKSWRKKASGERLTLERLEAELAKERDLRIRAERRSELAEVQEEYWKWTYWQTAHKR